MSSRCATTWRGTTITTVPVRVRALVIGAGGLFGVGAAQFRGTPATAQPGIGLFDFFR